MTQAAGIGVIGGSGLYEMDGAEVIDRLAVTTPFGAPSDEVTLVELGGQRVAFIPRHGRGHVFPPHAVPYRANIFAMKALGVRRLVGVNAVGSLVEEYAPGDLAMPDNLFDRTWGRESSFFDSGLVGHVDLAEPFCRGLRSDLLSSDAHVVGEVHHGGTLVVIQGPRFSTKAESEFHRQAGFKLVGMTSLPEAALAREAGMCYAALCIVTDYDVWHAAEEVVTAEMVLDRLKHGSEQAKTLLRESMPALEAREPCDHRAGDPIVTTPNARDPDLAAKLATVLAEPGQVQLSE